MGEAFYKKILLKISQKSQEGTCAKVSFLIKLQPCEFCENFMIISLTKHLRMTASVKRLCEMVKQYSLPGFVSQQGIAFYGRKPGKDRSTMMSLAWKINNHLSNLLSVWMEANELKQKLIFKKPFIGATWSIDTS